MSQYASVKKRTKDAKAPCPSTLIHNARLDKNIEYLLPKHLRLKNYHMTPISNATKTFNSWKRENEDRYQKIKNRKLRSDAHRLESLLIILSEEQINKCKPDDIWERAHVFKEWFEMKYETKVRTMDWHRDEGHSDEDENDDHKLETRNNHIHLEFDNVNNQGKMVRRLFSKGDLKIFQDKIAEIYASLGFIRGEDTAKSHRNDMPKRGLGQEAFRSKKKVESKEKKIKKEMELLREELQKWQAKDSHYIQLSKKQEELRKKLLEQEINYSQAIQKIKEESQKIIDILKFEAEEKNREIDELKDKNNILEENYTDLTETKNIKIKELQSDIAIHKIIDKQRIEKINTQYTEIDNHKKSINDSEGKIKILEEQVQEFKKSTEPTGYIIEGETVSKKIYDYMEVKDRKIESLEQKDKAPEILEVIKEVSIELTPEEIMHSEIETEYGFMKIGDVIKKQKEQIHKLTVSTGYEIEGESVSEKLYEYMEEKRHVLNYKSSRVESLEEKLVFQKERVVARDNLMKNQQDRYEQIVKEYNENIEVKDNKIESLGQQIEALEKDVFSETWTRKDAKGEKQRSKNINVVKQLEKKREELKDIIETLNLLAYTETEYPIEFDENDKPVKFEKETWKEKAEYAEDQVKNLTLETDWQSEKISELGDLAYHDEQIYNSEIADFDYITIAYKDENKILEKELDEAKEIIETIRDYNVPISQLGEFWDEIKVTVLGTSWEKRDESSENETQQDTIKLKHGKKKIGEDQDSLPTPGR